MVVPIEQRWLSVEEAAEYLNIPIKTLRDWRYRRVEPSAKFGRLVGSASRISIWALTQRSA